MLAEQDEKYDDETIGKELHRIFSHFHENLAEIIQEVSDPMTPHGSPIEWLIYHCSEAIPEMITLRGPIIGINDEVEIKEEGLTYIIYLMAYEKWVVVLQENSMSIYKYGKKKTHLH